MLGAQQTHPSKGRFTVRLFRRPPLKERERETDLVWQCFLNASHGVWRFVQWQFDVEYICCHLSTSVPSDCVMFVVSS